MFDVSAALLKLLTEDIPPHLPPEAIHQPNAFRQYCCYTAEARNPNPNPNPSPNPNPNPNPDPTLQMDGVLRKHEATLRAVFVQYARSTPSPNPDPDPDPDPEPKPNPSPSPNPDQVCPAELGAGRRRPRRAG